MKNYLSFFSAMLLAASILSGCGNQTTNNESKGNENNKDGVLKVYTTIYPLEDFTKKIGGEYVDVKSIMPPNVDAHSFEPTTKDMIDLANSDLFIHTGTGVEGFADKATPALEKENVTIIKAANNIELLPVSEEHNHDEHAEAHNHDDQDESAHEDEHSHGDTDPHVWLDPKLSIQMAENIKNTLVEKLPSHRETFESNFKTLKEDLEQLDKEFKETIENSKTKYLLVSHAAYGYWERYGIKQIAINGLSPSVEPSQRGLQNLIEESKEHDIHYIMFEKNVSGKIAKIIQKEIGAKTLTLYNLESISEEDRNNKEDYFSIMRNNLENIKIALNSTN